MGGLRVRVSSVIHTRADWDQLVHAPSVQGPRGCLCMTCGRLVDSEGLSQHPDAGAPGVTTYARWVVEHHGGHEERRFDMGSTNWDLADLAQMARRTNWFDPTRHEGLGLGHKNLTPGEHDGL